MSGFSPEVAMQIVAPSDSDWIVVMRLEGGEIVPRRVSPSTLPKEEAQRRAILSLGARRHLVRDATIRRAGDRTIVAP